MSSWFSSPSLPPPPHPVLSHGLIPRIYWQSLYVYCKPWTLLKSRLVSPTASITHQPVCLADVPIDRCARGEPVSIVIPALGLLPHSDHGKFFPPCFKAKSSMAPLTHLADFYSISKEEEGSPWTFDILLPVGRSSQLCLWDAAGAQKCGFTHVLRTDPSHDDLSPGRIQETSSSSLYAGLLLAVLEGASGSSLQVSDSVTLCFSFCLKVPLVCTPMTWLCLRCPLAPDSGLPKWSQW